MTVLSPLARPRRLYQTPRAASLKCHLLPVALCFWELGKVPGLSGGSSSAPVPHPIPPARAPCVAERFNPVFVDEDTYVTWRTAPYNSAAWNKYTAYLPRLPKEAKMETVPRGVPLRHPPRPEHLDLCEGQAVADALGGVSRPQLPSLQRPHAAAARKPCQGYYSPCSGRHYCLRGMDYYADGGLAASRHLHPLAERTEYPVLQVQPRSTVLCTFMQPAAILPVYEP